MKRGYDQNPPQPKRKHQSSRGGRGYGGQQRYSHNGQQSHTSRRQPDQQHYQPHHRNDWNDDHRFAFSRTYDQQERTSAIQQQPPQKHQEIVTVDMPTWQSMSYEQKLQQLVGRESSSDLKKTCRSFSLIHSRHLTRTAVFVSSLMKSLTIFQN